MTGGETFFARWSRLKRVGGETPAPGPGAAPAPLPDPETLGFDDDFSGFLRREVEEGVKRVALRKLFHSAQFNVMDGLDVYIDDYTIPSPIDAATIRGLVQARDMLFADAAEASPAPAAEAAAVAVAEPLTPAAALPDVVAGADHAS